MLDPLQFYCWVLCNGMKMRFRMVMIAHPGPGIGFHKRFMWRIIIPPTAGNTEKGVKQGKGSYLLLSMKKDQANKTNVEGVYRRQPLAWEPGLNGSSVDLQLV